MSHLWLLSSCPTSGGEIPVIHKLDKIAWRHLFHRIHYYSMPLRSWLCEDNIVISVAVLFSYLVNVNISCRVWNSDFIILNNIVFQSWWMINEKFRWRFINFHSISTLIPFGFGIIFCVFRLLHLKFRRILSIFRLCYCRALPHAPLISATPDFE